VVRAGPDGALWFTYGDTILRITTSGAITTVADDTNGSTQDPTVVGADGIAAGPDGALWFTNLETSAIGRNTTIDSVTTSPAQGPAETAGTITGAGFAGGETMAVNYETGLTSPTSVMLCSATAAGDGSVSCTASVPANGGP
jgi:hypothetical protein